MKYTDDCFEDEGIQLKFEGGMTKAEQCACIVITRDKNRLKVRREIPIVILLFAAAAAIAVLVPFFGLLRYKVSFCMAVASFFVSALFGLYIRQIRKKNTDRKKTEEEKEKEEPDTETEPIMVMCGVIALLFAFIGVTNGNAWSTIMAVVMMPLFMTAFQKMNDIAYEKKIISVCGKAVTYISNAEAEKENKKG